MSPFPTDNNRAIAIAQRGLEEIRPITNSDRLASYAFYHAALGEVELQGGKPEKAREYLQSALARARNPMARQFFEQRIGVCKSAALQDSV